VDLTLTLPQLGKTVEVCAGETVFRALCRAGFPPEAPCGGNGQCGKCRVRVNGKDCLACRTVITEDCTVELPRLPDKLAVLLEGSTKRKAEGIPVQSGSLLAFDIGTTTIAAYLLREDGTVLAEASRRNPQARLGADVVTRIQAALHGSMEELTALVRSALADLTAELSEKTGERAFGTVCVVGNPCMQQLFLGIRPDNLVEISFAPVLTWAQTSPAGDVLPCWQGASLLTVPDLSGYVGADTLACILAAEMDIREDITLLVDIGTNGEMVLGNRERMIACSTAAGPALEGANIRFGMGAAPGAIDRVEIVEGALSCHVLGDGPALGICGSGLIDAVACLVKLGLVNKRGRLQTDALFEGERAVPLAGNVWLTQNDLRQFQLAKGAIAAGIRLLLRQLGIGTEAVDRLLLAGAFGSFIRPESACTVGLLPAELLEKTRPIGNAAGSGAKLMARSADLFAHSERVARETEVLELGSCPEFQLEFAKGMWL